MSVVPNLVDRELLFRAQRDELYADAIVLRRARLGDTAKKELIESYLVKKEEWLCISWDVDRWETQSASGVFSIDPSIIDTKKAQLAQLESEITAILENPLVVNLFNDLFNRS